MKPLHIVFMGSPEFAVPSLLALAQKHHIVSVITQPDKPKGRGKASTPPAVKIAALELKLDIHQPESLRSLEIRNLLTGFNADLFVVVAYGKILGRGILNMPRLGCINVHASLLPRYRGAAPIQWAIIQGESHTGITVMRMAEGLDTGPILVQRETSILDGETAGSLNHRLSELGADMLLPAIEQYALGVIEPIEQSTEGISFSPLLQKKDGWIDFSQSAKCVDARIRGMDPWPGAFTSFQCEDLKLFHSRLAVGHKGKPGEVLAIDRRGVLVACGEDSVWIEELQCASRRRMASATLCCGKRIQAGTILGAV